MTIPAAREHSLAQLHLLSRAVTRARGEQGLIDLQVAITGAAAGFVGKKVEREVKALQKQLEKMRDA